MTEVSTDLKNDGFCTGRYRHFKGNYYYVMGLALDDGGERYVVYRADYGNLKWWVRPASMFFEDVPGGVQRFERCESKGECAIVEQWKRELIDGNILVQNTETQQKYMVILSSDACIMSLITIDSSDLFT